MVANRRRGEPAIPQNKDELLNTEQHDGLRKLEQFGWELKFLRRPQFEAREVVLVYSDETSYAILAEDGTLDQKTELGIRKSDRDEQFFAQENTSSEDAWQEPGAGELEDTLDYLEERAPDVPAEKANTAGKEPLPSKGGDGKPPKYLV